MHTVPDYSKGYTYRELVSRSIAWGHFFLFFNILFAIFAGFAYVYAAPSAQSFVSFLYLFITWLGHMTFLTFVVYLVILFPLSFIGNYRYYRVISVIVGILFFAVLLFDIKLYLTVRVHLSAMALSLIFTKLDFNTGLNYNFLFIAIPIVIAVELGIAKLSTKCLYEQTLRQRRIKAVILAVLGTCFAASHVMHIWADAWQYDKITALRQAFPAHYPMTAKSFLESHGYLDPNRSRQETVFNIVYPLEPIALSAQGGENNVVTISLNGISYSSLNAENTPQLLSLKQRSHSFEGHFLPYESYADNYFALAYGLPTSYRASLEAQHQAPVVIDGFYRREYTARAVESPADEKKRRGYGIIGLRQVAMDSTASNADVKERALEQIAAWQDGKRYALMLSFNDLLKFEDESSYNRSLREADAAVGEIIAALDARGLLGRTLVIITSNQGSPFVSDGSRYYDRQRQHVPLMVLWPNSDNIAVSTSALSSPYDVAATIGAEIVGITNSPSVYTLGHDLRALPERGFVVSDEDEDIVLVGKQYSEIYTQEGEVLTETGGRELAVNPQLEDLISAMRDLNRFME